MGLWDKLKKSLRDSNDDHDQIVKPVHFIPADEESKLRRLKNAMNVMKRRNIYMDEDFISIAKYITNVKSTTHREVEHAFPDIHSTSVRRVLSDLSDMGIISSKFEDKKRTEFIVANMETREIDILFRLLTHRGGQYDFRLIRLGAKFSSNLTENDIDNKAARMLWDKFGKTADYQDENIGKLLINGSGIIQRANERAYTDFIQLLLAKCKPTGIRFVFISMGRSLDQYNDFPQVLVPFISYQEQLEYLLSYLDEEIRMRREIIANSGAKDYLEYNKAVFRVDEKILPFMLVFDELSSVKMTKAFVSSLESILIYGSTCAVFIIGFSAFNGSALRLGRLRPFLYFRDSNWCLNVFSSFGENEGDGGSTYDSLSGEDFEKACAELLSQNGFGNIQLTPESGDYGGDILAEKDQIKYVIQCKRYSSSIGISAVQEVIASRSIYKCHVGVVMTNSHFTNAAIRLANENNILLWDGDYLNKLDARLKNRD